MLSNCFDQMTQFCFKKGHKFKCIFSWFVLQLKLLQPEEETEEEKNFRAIYQQIAGEVSN